MRSAAKTVAYARVRASEVRLTRVPRQAGTVVCSVFSSGARIAIAVAVTVTVAVAVAVTVTITIPVTLADAQIAQANEPYKAGSIRTLTPLGAWTAV
jgi:hypothetical protein